MMRPSVALAAVLSTSGCLLVNPAYGDEDTGTTSAGGTALTTGDASAGNTSGSPATSSASTEGSGSASDSATTGSVDSTGPVTTGTTGCVEESLYVDADGDGYGEGQPVMVCAGTLGHVPQGGDCDGAAGNINPGAVELCDMGKVDEDCDGLKNESSPMNASCDGCALAEYGGHSYWFCGQMVTWDAARQLCNAFGAADLVIIDDMAENQWVFPQHPTPDTWLGGRDSDPQGFKNYTWWNGAPLTFNGFALADLDNGCIAMPDDDGSLWRDRDCSFPYGFVCESL